jgi:hypothetical protein
MVSLHASISTMKKQPATINQQQSTQKQFREHIRKVGFVRKQLNINNGKR